MPAFNRLVLSILFFVGLNLSASSQSAPPTITQSPSSTKQSKEIPLASGTSPNSISLPSPQKLTAQVKSSLAKVRASCVSVFSGGYGSGVIISPDGLVITAAHMMRNLKSYKDFTIHLEDGRKAKAKLLGFNRESDYALLQITSPTDTTWPSAPLADTAELTGKFCFTMAHPGGRKKGRPAQVRIGRITSHSTQRKKPFYLIADLDIQPGDSGGPLFSIDGKLIGLDSSATGYLGFNIFPAIDQYHLDKKRFLKGDRWGDIKNAPDGPRLKKTIFDKEALAGIQKEFMRRVQMKYPPTMDFLGTLKNKKGTVELDQQAMINHLIKDAIAISKKHPVSLGLNDPALNRQLPALPKNAARGLPIYHKDKQLCRGIAVDPHHILTKASILPDQSTDLFLKFKKVSIPVKCVAIDKEWDLALLEISQSQSNKKIKLPAITWPQDNATSAPHAVQAGDLIMARDRHGRLIWNIATDQARPIKKKISIGPLNDKSIISKRRHPFPLAVRHALPLFADDAGAPLFDAQGNLIGMHIARRSRTMGLFIPTKQLHQQSKKLLTNAK